ncbi:MAG: sigma factor [Acidobacteriota bacterium]
MGVEQILTLAGSIRPKRGEDVGRLDPEAADRLTHLFQTQHLRLYRLARRLSGDPEEARDLVQQTFLRAAGRMAFLPGGDQAAAAWLVRTLVNLCRDQVRRQRIRRRTVPPSPASGSTPESASVARATVQ